MKKFLTFSALILALAITFTACPEPGPGPDGTTEADNAAITAAKTVIEAAPFTALQADVTTAAQAKAAAQAIIDGLDLDGVTAVIVEGSFATAVAGTSVTERGTNGTYTFTVKLTKGTGTEKTTTTLTLTIIASTPDEIPQVETTSAAAGLYLYKDTITATDTPIDVSGQSGGNNFAKAFNYVKSNPGSYILLMDSNANDNGGQGYVLDNPITLLKLIGLGSQRRILSTAGGAIFTVKNSARLMLGNNIKLEGDGSNGYEALVKVNGGVLIMEDGSLITSNNNKDKTNFGGGVFMNSGQFLIKGGEISANSAANGGGVYMSGGTFTMDGGKISTNSIMTPTDPVILGGGGVFVAGGNFTMNSGEISGNSVVTNQGTGRELCRGGGGVYIAGGTFTMNSGKIDGNTADSTSAINGYLWHGGGGVFVGSNAAFTMKNGQITNNIAKSKSLELGNSMGGGGVFVANNGGSFTMSGGEISGNSVVTDQMGGGRGGGGVALGSGTGKDLTVTVPGGKFTMIGGVIKGNKTPLHGGGVFVGKYNATFQISNGTIYGSSSDANSNIFTKEPFPIIGPQGQQLGAALYLFGASDEAPAVAERGYFSDSTWNKSGGFSTTSETIDILNGNPK